MYRPRSVVLNRLRRYANPHSAFVNSTNVRVVQIERPHPLNHRSHLLPVRAHILHRRAAHGAGNPRQALYSRAAQLAIACYHTVVPILRRRPRGTSLPSCSMPFSANMQHQPVETPRPRPADCCRRPAQTAARPLPAPTRPPRQSRPRSLPPQTTAPARRCRGS